jgi:hypothetical protein
MAVWAALWVGAGAVRAIAQTASIPARLAPDEGSSLPDAPEPAGLNADSNPALAQDVRVSERTAGPFDKFVEAGEVAPQLTVGDKVLIGMRGSVSPYAVIGWISSATYSEAIDGSPYYGQDSKNYLQRLGAAAAKATSEDIFTNSVLAPLLHEDPRYYQMGHGHSLFARFGFSVTRVLVTKTDAGRQTVNYAVLGGNLAGSALTQAYYPPESRGFGQVMKTYGTSLLGQAVGNVFDEFILSSAEFLQLKKKTESRLLPRF